MKEIEYRELEKLLKDHVEMESMNYLLSKLTEGDLRSDGKADEVVETIFRDPELLPLLIEGLEEPDDVVRARTTHSFEKISRTYPDLLTNLIQKFIDLALHDDVPMVRWHMAMIFGNLSYSGDEIREIFSVLFRMLKDESIFVRTWAIASLCELGTLYKDEKEHIVRKIRLLEGDDSIAVRVRVQKAIAILQDGETIPPGWIKRRRS
jgi:HEAT repeat protein